MEQSAVNFLIEQIIDKQPAGFYRIDSQEECYKLFERARQMEKEQIIKAYTNGSPEFSDMAEEYYNETITK